MVKFRFKVKFPCGLEIEEEYKVSILFLNIKSNIKDYQCPIHKDKCKKKNEK